LTDDIIFYNVLYRTLFEKEVVEVFRHRISKNSISEERINDDECEDSFSLWLLVYVLYAIFWIKDFFIKKPLEK